MLGTHGPAGHTSPRRRLRWLISSRLVRPTAHLLRTHGWPPPLASPESDFQLVSLTVTPAAVGTEANPAAFEHARGRSLDARNSWLHQTGFGERRFDLVFSCGNFGHLPEPRATVEKARSVLKPDGLVCVAREPLAAEDAPPQGTAPVGVSLRRHGPPRLSFPAFPAAFSA